MKFFAYLLIFLMISSLSYSEKLILKYNKNTGKINTWWPEAQDSLISVERSTLPGPPENIRIKDGTPEWFPQGKTVQDTFVIIGTKQASIEWEMKDKEGNLVKETIKILDAYLELNSELPEGIFYESWGVIVKIPTEFKDGKAKIDIKFNRSWVPGWSYRDRLVIITPYEQPSCYIRYYEK